jgi:formate hydrogenlyase transcriptional activator
MKYNARFKRSIISIGKQSLQSLQEYHWPGNVRELENLVERVVLSANGAAAILGLPPSTLRRRIRKPGLKIRMDELH